MLKIASNTTEGLTRNIVIEDGVTVINVRNEEYGAVGDGVTDDTVAIQNALYAAEESGLPLYIPAGTYKVSHTITTHTRDTVEGQAEQSTALHIYGSGMNTVFTTTDTFEGDYVFYIDVADAQPRSLWVHDFAIDLTVDVSGIYFREIGMKSVVENLWITYKYLKKETDTTVRAGIFCDQSTVATFQRIKIQGHIKGLNGGPMNCGMVFRQMHSTKIIDCDVIFCGWAIYLSGGSNNLIENCRIDENEYGIFQNSSTDYKQELRAYQYNESPDETEPQFKGTFSNLTIRKNRFESNNQKAIFLASYSNGALNYMWNAQVTIADNYFSGLGMGTTMWTNRQVFRTAIWLYRCKGVLIDGNEFKGMPYDSTVSTADQQNIYGNNVSDVTLKDNISITWPNGKDEEGNTVVVKSSTVLSETFINILNFISDIELQQTSRAVMARAYRSRYTTKGTGGAIDVSDSNIHKLADGLTVTGINIENGAAVKMCQEVTLVAEGTATVRHTNQIRLKGGTDFVMGLYDTLTLIRIWCNGQLRWVEKCRSVYAPSVNTAEEG